MTPAATRAPIPFSGVLERGPVLVIFSAAFVMRMSRYLTFPDAAALIQ